MCDRTDAFGQRPGRQKGIRIQRKALVDILRQRSADERKWVRIPCHKQFNQVAQRTTFALPPHINAVKAGKLPPAVQKIKDRRAAICIPCVERINLLLGLLEQLSLPIAPFLRAVLKIA